MSEVLFAYSICEVRVYNVYRHAITILVMIFLNICGYKLMYNYLL